MSDIKRTVADNINKLRSEHHMTQMEMAEKLNYTDKAVSKWERAESLPDVSVLKKIGELYGVSVDYLLSEHKPEDQPIIYHIDDTDSNHRIITMIAVTGLWTIVLIGILLCKWIKDEFFWQLFIYALPFTFIILIVFNSIWSGKRILNFWYTSGILWSLLATAYVSFLKFLDLNLWQMFILGVSGEIIVFLSFRLRKTHKK